MEDYSALVKKIEELINGVDSEVGYCKGPTIIFNADVEYKEGYGDPSIEAMLKSGFDSLSKYCGGELHDGPVGFYNGVLHAAEYMQSKVREYRIKQERENANA